MGKKEAKAKRLLFYTVIIATTLFYRCASVQNPMGGPKDATPPKVLKMEPKNLTKNFKAKKIVIEFNEYFKLQNEFKEISISPEMEKPPEIKTNGKKIEIAFVDSLEKNTTYTLNFGKAIADVTEGNVVKNLSYVFATGNEIDSLSISGNINNALAGKPELEALVFILPLEKDSLFGKKRPAIYTTTDSSGNYKLNNLKKGIYKVYTIKETGGDKIYQQNNDEVGFLAKPLKLTKDTGNINLMVFKELAPEFKVLDRRINPDGSIFLNFTQQLKDISLSVVEPKGFDEGKKIKFNKTNDSARLWLKDLSFDTIKVDVSSNEKVLQSVKISRGKKDTYLRSVIPIDNLEGNILNPFSELRLTFTLPIDSANSTKITFLEDSVKKTNYSLIKDSANFLAYKLKYPWQAKKNYDLTFAEGAFTAIFKTKNKLFNKKFEVGKKDDYGTLILKVEVQDSLKSYVLEVINESKTVVNSIIITKNTSVTFANYKAGKYFVRLVYDINKNGIWDTGNVSKNQQPEKIYYEPKELSIRANWERKETIIIPK